jgi:hypothetical protein
MIKGAHSGVLIPSVFEYTGSGAINDLDFNGADILKLTNGSLGAVSGFKAGFPGQILAVIATNSPTAFADQDTNSVAANRLINFCHNRTALAIGGIVIYQYDAVTQRWRLINHEQGAFLPGSVTWTATTTNPVLNNGTLVGYYYGQGKFIDYHINLVIGSTTTLGSGLWLFSLPGSFAGGYASVGSGFVTSGGGATNFAAVCSITTAFDASGQAFGTLAATGVNIAHNQPVGMTTGDILRFSIQGIPVT